MEDLKLQSEINHYVGLLSDVHKVTLLEIAKSLSEISQRHSLSDDQLRLVKEEQAAYKQDRKTLTREEARQYVLQHVSNHGLSN